MLLKVEDVKKAARDYYAKGLLTAQAPEKGESVCVNILLCADGVERRCAVAAAYPEKMCKEYRTLSVDTMRWNGQLRFENENEGQKIIQIQKAHDAWARSRWQNSDSTVAKAKQEFLALIGLG